MTDLTVYKNLIEALQKTADKINGNGDGKLDIHEEEAIQLFNCTIAELKNNGAINQDAFKEAMGLYVSNPSKAEGSTNVENAKPKEMTKEEKKHFEATKKVFEGELEYVIKNKRATNKTLVALLTEKLDGNATVEPYATYIKKVDTLLTDKMKKKLKENEQYEKAYSTIETEFQKQALSIKKANPKLTFAEAQMRVDHEEFLDNMKDKLEEEKNEQAGNAIKAFKKKVLKPAAYTVAMKEISEQNSEKWKDVRFKSKYGMKIDGTWNDYTKSALKGNSFKNRITGQSSNGKLASQAQANYNKVDDATWQREDEVIKVIGRELFEKLKGAVDPETNNPLIEKFNGQWCIKNLQEALTNMVGKGDHEWSRHNKQIDSNTSEIARSQGQITLYNALENCDKDDVENLIELCGIPKEKKNWYRATMGALIGATIGFANGVAAGGFAAATNPDQTVKDGDLNLDASTHIEINITNGESLELGSMQNFPEGTEIVQIGTSIIVDIDKIIHIPGAIIELSKHVGETALKAGLASAIAPAIAGFINGLKDNGEIEVFSKYLDGTDLEAYAERVSKEAPKYAPYAILLATYFSKNGQIDKEAMEQFLEDMGGHGGKVNPKELQGSILDMLRKKPVVKGTETKTEQNEECEDYKCMLKVSSETTEGTCSHTVKHGDTWGNMVRAYYPELVAKYGEYGAVKKWQKAMYTDENGNFDNAGYKALTQNRTLTDKNGKGLELPLPTEIDGCKRAGCSDDITIKKANEAELAGSEEYRSKNYGKATTTLGQLVGIHRAPTTKFTATDCFGNEQEGSSAKEAVTKLKENTKLEYANEDEYLK